MTVDAIEVSRRGRRDAGRRAAAAVRHAEDRRAAGPAGRLRPDRPGRDRRRRGGARRHGHATSPTRSAATSSCRAWTRRSRAWRRRSRRRSPPQLVAGDFAGRDAEVAVTVRTVKERELPAVDDDFAQLASEFDTLDELRADLPRPVGPGQAGRAALLRPRQGARGAGARADVPAPGGRGPRRGRRPQAGDDRPARAHGRHAGGLPRRPRARPRRSSTAELAEARRAGRQGPAAARRVRRRDEIQVTDDEYGHEVVHRAQRAGVAPQQYYDQLVRAGMGRARSTSTSAAARRWPRCWSGSRSRTPTGVRDLDGGAARKSDQPTRTPTAPTTE